MRERFLKKTTDKDDDDAGTKKKDRKEKEKRRIVKETVEEDDDGGGEWETVKGGTAISTVSFFIETTFQGKNLKVEQHLL